MDKETILTDILNRKTGHEFEAMFYLGSRVRTPVRLVACRVAEAVVAARRRHAKAKAQAQGKTWTATYLAWLGWEVLVTNLAADWSVDDLFVLYGLRWQIELIFKVWKSQLGLARYGQGRAERVMCQFYAHLIGALLCQRLLPCCVGNREEQPVLRNAGGPSGITSRPSQASFAAIGVACNAGPLSYGRRCFARRDTTNIRPRRPPCNS